MNETMLYALLKKDIRSVSNKMYKFKDAAYLFCQNHRLDEIEQMNVSESKSFYYTFQGCAELTSIPQLDTSNGTNFVGMFKECLELTSIPQLDTSNGTSFSSMFYRCGKLISIPQLDRSNGKNFERMFYGCGKLISIPKINLYKATNVNQIFYNCRSLTNLYLYNINIPITIGSGTSYGHLLTVDSLVHTIKELCKVNSTTTLTIGPTNLKKITSLYCKVIDASTEKIDMELCDSTEDGAITLKEYAKMKNWTIQ